METPTIESTSKTNAEEVFKAYLSDDVWYKENKGKYAAVVGKNVFIRSDIDTLIGRVKNMYLTTTSDEKKSIMTPVHIYTIDRDKVFDYNSFP